MAKFGKRVRVPGEWVEGKALKSGDVVVLTDAAFEMPSQFSNEKTGELKKQTVAHCTINGQSGKKDKPLIVRINVVSQEALIDAFGDDSEKWIGNNLIVQKEKTRVGGKAQIAVYLIPEEWKLMDDESDYAHIIPNSFASVEDFIASSSAE